MNSLKLVHHSILFIVAALTLVACQPKELKTPEPTSCSSTNKLAYLKKSEELAGKLQQALSSRLMAAMKEGGSIEAISICQRLAQDTTEIVGAAYENTTIRRTALRVRNPLNKPEPYSVTVLENWEVAAQEGKVLKPSYLEKDDVVIVHRPIMTAAICLQCHGNVADINKDILARLRELYAEDEATGFSEGDLRGAFRIEFAQE